MKSALIKPWFFTGMLRCAKFQGLRYTRQHTSAQWASLELVFHIFEAQTLLIWLNEWIVITVMFHLVILVGRCCIWKMLHRIIFCCFVFRHHTKHCIPKPILQNKCTEHSCFPLYGPENFIKIQTWWS